MGFHFMEVNSNRLDRLKPSYSAFCGTFLCHYGRHIRPAAKHLHTLKTSGQLHMISAEFFFSELLSTEASPHYQYGHKLAHSHKHECRRITLEHRD